MSSTTPKVGVRPIDPEPSDEPAPQRATASSPGTEALIPEARRRQRRRWLAIGAALLIATFGGWLVANASSGGHARKAPPSKRPAPSHSASGGINVTRHVRGRLAGPLQPSRQFGQVVSVGNELFATAQLCPPFMPGSPACKGQIVVSKDGGRDWSVELSSPMLMDDLAFAGRLHGWATAGGPSQDGCGPPTVPCGDEVLKSSTSNGGLVWRGVKALRGSPAAFLALSGSAAVVSDDTCKYGIWICHASVLATQDGGRTWNKVRTPPGLVVGLARWPGEIIALELVNLPRYEQQYGGRLGGPRRGFDLVELVAFRDALSR